MRWMRVGTQDDQWKSAQIYIKPPLFDQPQQDNVSSTAQPLTDGSTIDFQFTAVMAMGVDGDIAIDDISFKHSQMCQWSKYFI